MDLFNVAALLISFSALFAWLNQRTLRLPTTIGVMAIALLFSLGLLALGRLGLASGDWFTWFHEVEFAPTLLDGMLGFLLFAGALHVDLGDLREQRWVVSFLATLGVLISTLLIAAFSWWLFGAIGLRVSWAACLAFGALISPTDPIAVLAVLKQAGVPKSLETKITGESLFNDGVGLVVFLLVVGAATREGAFDPSLALGLLVQEAIGGVALGLLLGSVAYGMLRSVDSPQVEVLITLALVTGGYALAHALHTSGPLAMVAAGLLIGNHGRRFAMSDATRDNLDTFWELVDEILNAVLFVMIGFELLLLDFTPARLIAGLLAIPLVLGARTIAVGAGVSLLRIRRTFSPHAVKIMAWGGLRGGISVALALQLPAGPERDLIVGVTYTVVAFSILVQGLTLGPFVRRLYRKPA
ncbi:MAG: sodium:proton antiporter [bacterium]|nr:sodium:proton antiporter [bacterium]